MDGANQIEQAGWPTNDDTHRTERCDPRTSFKKPNSPSIDTHRMQNQYVRGVQYAGIDKLPKSSTNKSKRATAE